MRHPLFASLALVAGCLDGALDKGEEDDVPTDGKADSFREPTEHGAIPFNAASSAAFTVDEGFHSWTFTLTGSANVDLQTDAGTNVNLDTVAYLYKKSGSSWGAYIAKNDDANNSTADSQIKKQLTAGEYRLIVKAYKRTQRGAFHVLGTCDGAGCPVPPVCEAPATMPAQTAYTASCGTKLAAVFETGRLASSSYQEQVALSTRCDGPSAIERKAMDYYAEYWSANEEEDFFYNIETQVIDGASANGGGTIVTVDDGGDESSMRFVFDKDDTLLAYYQSNQSPDIAFFCGGSGAAIELPNAEDCLSSLTSGTAHDDGDESPLSLTAAPNDLPTGTSTEVRAAFTRYQTTNSTAASTKLTANGATWEEYDATAGIFTLKATNKPLTRYVVGGGMVLLEAPTGGSAALVCE